MLFDHLQFPLLGQTNGALKFQRFNRITDFKFTNYFDLFSPDGNAVSQITISMGTRNTYRERARSRKTPLESGCRRHASKW